MTPPKRVLAIRLSALGDICMTLPVIDSVCRAYPDVQITLLTSRAGVAVAKTVLQLPNLSLLSFNKDDYKGIGGLNRLYRELSALGFDAVADLHDVLRTQWLDLRFRIAGKPVARIDKGRKEKSALTSHRQFVQLTSGIERYRLVFVKLGLDCKVDYDGRAHAQLLLDQPCAVKASKWNAIGIAPFAQHRGKVYPEDLTRKVIAELVKQRPDIKIYLFGGPEEQAQLDTWVIAHPQNVVNRAGRQSLTDDLRCMANLSLMISMDSANMHLASLVGLRCLSIWGATHRYAGFLGYGQSEDDCIEITSYPCRPCSIYGNKACQYNDYHCLTDIMP